MNKIVLIVVLLQMSAMIAIGNPIANGTPGGDPTSNEHSESIMAGVLVIKQQWLYGSSERRGWEYRRTNEWGGRDHWCISPYGTACGLWDWMTIYEFPIDAAVIQESRCAEYGDELMRATAASEEVELPPDLPLPVYEEVTE